MLINIDLPLTRKDDILSKILSRTRIYEDNHKQYSYNGLGCWIWQGPDSGKGRGGGYGRMSLSGCTVATHIVIYTHYFGYIPYGKQIDHLCKNRACCNPNHLEMVTHKQNQRRRRNK